MKNRFDMTARDVLHLFRTEWGELVDLASRCGDSGQFVRKWMTMLLQTKDKAEDFQGKRSVRYKDLRGNARKYLFRLSLMEGRTETDAASGEKISLQTLHLFWRALRGDEKAVSADFLWEMYFLLKQLNLSAESYPGREVRSRWSERWLSGLDQEVQAERADNRKRIQQLLIEKIEKRGKVGMRYYFEPYWGEEEKWERIKKWWYDYNFHLTMAIRDPDELNLFLNNTLSGETMELLYRARKKNIPFFITPYYLSLLNVKIDGYDDEAIRCYVIYSKELVDEFGQIKAWEKEDEVIPGEPNAAGWLLPNEHNIHRRYPEVAIFIPDSMGRACGGLCAPCQRMYDFQKGHLNFDLEALKPMDGWSQKLEKLIKYYEKDSQLCDILITGGDSLMSRDKTLEEVLDAVYRMAVRKREANYKRKMGTKYAEIQRVRLGSRLPAYLPYRVTDNLVTILKKFREKAEKIGVRQFFIQTHFESPLEVTEEVVEAIGKLLSAGWIVTNQLVFTVAASRRGHTARLREVLNKAGIITYYTFTVKGFGENYALFAPNSRSLQEKEEEKTDGGISPLLERELLAALEKPAQLKQRLNQLLSDWNQAFIATDRNVLNLPGIGKSMTFETMGLTAEGKRILCFELDDGRRHSPAVDGNNKVYIAESKSIMAYLQQLKNMGEDPQDYDSVWYYRDGVTESRFSLFEYPEKRDGQATFFTHVGA